MLQVTNLPNLEAHFVISEKKYRLIVLSNTRELEEGNFIHIY